MTSEKVIFFGPPSIAHLGRHWVPVRDECQQMRPPSGLQPPHSAGPSPGIARLSNNNHQKNWSWNNL